MGMRMVEINQVINKDALIGMKELPNECIDLIITSPPYFGCRQYGNETLGREENPLDYIQNLSEFFNENNCKRILKNSGSMYIVIGDVYFGTKGFSRNKGKYSRKTDGHYKEHKIVKEDGKYLQHKQLLLLPERLAVKLQEQGWILRNKIIWEKPNPIPSFSKDRRLPVYETILFFSKLKEYYFDYKKAKELNMHRDIIRCGIEAFKKHQASFPEKLIEPLILTSSKEGDIIFDPFMGSGTVGSVARNNNRQYLGFELNEEYCDIIKERK